MPNTSYNNINNLFTTWFRRCLTAVFFLPLLVSCGYYDNFQVYTFQQLATSWEDNLYAEFQREATFYDYIDFHFNIAKSPKEMSAQIDDAVRKGADAIVVNPFEGDSIVESVEKAFDAGVKVVLVGQKINTSKYTTFVGTDNKALGRAAASYVCSRIEDEGNIVVIESFRDAQFYKDRYSSFMSELRSHPKVKLVGSFDAAWSADNSHEGMDSLAVVLKGTPVDAVFAFCDDAILGASEAGRFPEAIYVGLDGLIGKGVNAVQAGKIDATFTNPTNGDEAIRSVVSILNGNYYQTELVSNPQVIDRANADAYSEAVQALEIARHKIDVLNEDVQWYKWVYRSQLPWLNAIIVLASLLLVSTVVAFWHNNILRGKCKKLDGQIAGMRDEMEHFAVEKEVADHLNKALTAQCADLQEMLLSASVSQKDDADVAGDALSESVFMKKFRDVITAHLDNPDLSINMLAEEIGVSRAQLYRKVKSNSGETPNDLIQAMRLEKAFEMLRDTDKTVSEVAYSVGFTSPSYFTKCYKDKFGALPKEAKSSQNIA